MEDTLMPLAPPLEITLAVLVAVAAVWDVSVRRIPNWLTLGGIVAGFAVRWTLFGWAGPREAALGMGLAFLIYFGLFALRAVGAGDVKLMMAAGALCGPSNWRIVFICSAICGGICALALILSRGILRSTLNNVLLLLGQLVRFRAPYRAIPRLDVRHPRSVKLPHGLSIALGSMLFLLFSHGKAW